MTSVYLMGLSCIIFSLGMLIGTYFSFFLTVTQQSRINKRQCVQITINDRQEAHRNLLMCYQHTVSVTVLPGHRTSQTRMQLNTICICVTRE